MTSTTALQITTPTDREIRITRTFDASRKLVYEAYTRPELVQRWLGNMPGWSWAACEMDVRVGGRYRWAWRADGGEEMGMGGVYREVVPGERLVNTERFDQPWYAGEAVATIAFTEQGGRTTVTTTLLYESKETRDGVLQSPATGGMEQSYVALDTMLAAATPS